MVAGMRFMLREPVLRTIAIAWAVLLLALGMTIVAEPALAVVFDSGSIGYGLLASAWGAGSVIGAVLAQRRLRADNEFAWLIVAVLIGGLGFGVTAVAPVLSWRCSSWSSGASARAWAAWPSRASSSAARPTRSAAGCSGALEATILLSLGGLVRDRRPGGGGDRRPVDLRDRRASSFLFAAAILSPTYLRDRARSVRTDLNGRSAGSPPLVTPQPAGVRDLH